MPALQRARVHRRAGRPLAAVAEGAPDGGRHAADQQRRRHHELRDAAAGPADARLRPRPGRRPAAARAQRARGRAAHDARRRAARVRLRRRARVRRRRPDRHRRDHGRRRAARSSAETTRVAMEAATWNGPNILQTSKKLGLRSEASGRFEKQLHPELALRAQRLAARLMVELCGARMVPGTVDVAAPSRRAAAHHAAHRAAREAARRAHRAGGVAGDPRAARLRRRRERDGDLEAEVPYFRRRRRAARGRPDRGGRADPRPAAAARHAARPPPGDRRAVARADGCAATIEDLLRARGPRRGRHLQLHRARRRATACASPASDERARVLPIANPLSEEQSVMRTTLLPGLLEVARATTSRATSGTCGLFETGRVFFSKGRRPLPDERLHLGGRCWRATSSRQRGARRRGRPTSTRSRESSWRCSARSACEWRLVDGGPPFLHPGRAAEVVVDAREAGWLGELHPLVARDFGLERPGAPAGRDGARPRRRAAGGACAPSAATRT